MTDKYIDAIVDFFVRNEGKSEITHNSNVLQISALLNSAHSIFVFPLAVSSAAYIVYTSIDIQYINIRNRYGVLHIT